MSESVLEPKLTFSSYLKALYDDNGGKPLPVDVSDYLVNCIYPMIIPDWIKIEGDKKQPLFTKFGTQLSAGYSGVFFSDYGPYIMVDQEQIKKGSLQQTTGNNQNNTSGNVTTHLIYKSADGELTARRQLRQAGTRSFPPGKYFFDVFSVCKGDLLPIEDGDLMKMDDVIICQPASCRGNYIDSISREVSERWPFVREEYEELCKSEEPLSLLGTYQVVVTNEDGTAGIANLFCNMATDRNHRHAGKNLMAMVNAVYALCCDAEQFETEITIAIPYMIGCENDADWEEVYRRLSCRLAGKNVKIINHKRSTNVIVQNEASISGENKPAEQGNASTNEDALSEDVQGQGSAAEPKEQLNSDLEAEDYDAVLGAVIKFVSHMPKDKLFAMATLMNIPVKHNPAEIGKAGVEH